MEREDEVDQLDVEMQQLAMFASNDPTTFEEAAKSPIWRKAMVQEIQAIERMEGFERCLSDHTLFTKNCAGGGILIISLYVDDFIFTGNNEHMFEKFKSSMKEEFDMSHLGCIKYFLGVEVVQNSIGIFISQKKYVNEVLERFGMERLNSVKNPIVPGSRLAKDEGGIKVDSTTFKQMVGNLMYLTATRPNLMYVVNLIARFMEVPTVLHQQALKRVFRYLKRTTELGILYKKGGEESLFAYSDSDYAGDLDGRKSTCYVFKMSSGAVAWSSKKQPIVSLSTTESEVHCCCCMCLSKCVDAASSWEAWP
ncbi:uncharacterized mitochondrial protein AtMg00810-like [Argentina anserina]|uniref:uncharacterized mitochondrial protein AtMg00810-like n=1 Tax=Argentina anserina TaxID=57926 RepID=UPI002176835D|nr:uncharacterized mitochondrial protein AtMg00810-like [Potentilla anserina]